MAAAIEPSSATAIRRWESVRRQLGERLSRNLLEEVSREDLIATRRLRVRVSGRLALAYLLALLVHGAGLGAGVAGVMLLAGAWNNLFIPLGGVALVLLCIAARPRLPQAPDHLLSRERFPALHALSDRIAAALGARPVDGIGVCADFNANYRVAGWRRERYVEIGSPLMAILTPAEQVALLAHELSHGVNGDPLRGQFLGHAVDTLAAWGTAARPLAIGQLGQGMAAGPIVSLVGLPFELLMLTVSELLFAAARGMLWLVMRESQRAEYLADLLAATVAGSAAMRGVLEKTYLDEVVDAAVRVHALTTPHDAIEPAVRGAAAAVGAAELDAHRAASRSESWRTDASHPPTAMRVDQLLRREDLPPTVALLPADEQALAEEVSRLLQMSQTTLVGRKLEAIYG
ncbi:M48 family metalloprotease [Roseateles sp. UC29_93]|uniref:M48 family metalloprotease n=1 Tax=Roseateles sp. UC29_93 TaxID=3350177 RepID=UPI00366B980D